MIVILFTLMLAVPAAHARDYRQSSVEAAIKDAVKTIDSALKRNSPMQEVLLQMREAFGNVQYLPRGQNYPHCEKKPGVRAFVTRDSGIIRLCSTLFDEKWDRSSLAQILLHESAHVADIHDECMATKYEIGALKLAKKSISFESDYWKTCKITRKFDPFQIVGAANP